MKVKPKNEKAPRPAVAADHSEDDMLEALARYMASELPHVADEIRACVEQQRRVWGGQEVYIRQMSSIERDMRRAQFLAAFNGRNKVELMRVYGVSRPTAQRWIEAYYRQRRAG